MSLNADVKKGIDDVLAPEWDIRRGRVVPEATDIKLRDGAVQLEASYLYADMADSTTLAQNYKPFAVAKVIRCYLNAASRLIRDRGGEIRSFDGDRVMGIFVGPHSVDYATMTAMNISWAVSEVIQPKLQAKWSDFKWLMKHGIGIDTGEAMLVRGGVLGDNDLISIGSAPNVAAKLSEQRGWQSIYITSRVYESLSDGTRLHRGYTDMWSRLGNLTIGGRYVNCYGSSYWWAP